MLKSCFFNSVLDPQGVPDRPFNADDFAKYFGTLIKNGVFPNPSTNFQCIADQETMAVKMEAGICWIDGHLGYDDNVHILEIDTADSVLDRIDRIVLRKDVLDRDIHWVVKKGEMSGKPVAPTLQRDENAWELGIADVKVAHGTVSISQSMVTDTRLNTELCGLVTGTVTQIDTTTLFNQLEQWKKEYIEATNTWTTEQEQAFLNWKQLFETAATDWRAGEEQKFDEWLQSIKGKLSGDVAGNLQNQIEELKEKILILEAGLNDYATELVKVALTQVVTAKWGVTPEKSFYCGIDHDKNTIEYVFYLNEEEPPVYQGIKMDVYQASLQIVESIVTEEPNAFLRIDNGVAKEILETHQHMQQEQSEQEESNQ